ncbi:MAG TPA: hypothetical protein VHA82_02260 [Ramlibacter sp.]|uniref:hypothetical protein n=1 Tax=Ramlibacter sp. TaxID=1917967 RepID=UPI002C04AB5D|nr:hypothetical protein [Ramlibacter sp.]HVZ42605.1 hypothetical protein [Ramlibacter sp.]
MRLSSDHSIQALVAAAICTVFALPCAAQQDIPGPSFPGGPVTNPAMPAFPITGLGSSTSTTTASTASSTTFIGRTQYGATTSDVLGSATTVGSAYGVTGNTYGVTEAATAANPPGAYTGSSIVNPALPTLHSTIGTIETGSASSLPSASSGYPLNMAPVGVALNSDLGPVRSTQVLGAGPAYMEAAPATPGASARAATPRARTAAKAAPALPSVPLVAREDRN